jgi:hypothetical protein
MYLVFGLSLQHIVIFTLCDRIYICFGWKKTIKSAKWNLILYCRRCVEESLSAIFMETIMYLEGYLDECCMNALTILCMASV